MSASKQDRQRTPGWSRWFVPVHMRLYRATNGLIGHRLGPQRTLLLTTTGRKSGQPRTQPTTYFKADGALILVASNWGNDSQPAWYLNLQAHPRVHIQLKGEQFDATAETASHDVRARLWPSIVAQNKQYASYEVVAAREIPLVLLHRI